MTLTALDFWIITAAVLSTLSCALLGNFLVLRRMSMMGDAISHAVLPGLAVAFLVTGTRNSFAMLTGAAIAGLLTAMFTQWIHSRGKVEEGASMGVVFTSLFAIGLLLIVRAHDANKIDLDPSCVLYGALEAVGFTTPDEPVPAVVVRLGSVFLLNVAFVTVFFKELRITSFDPELATTLGINATLMHYLLMAMVAMTTVACFESVGSILVIAMLIVPAAAAHLCTDRLLPMVLLSLVFGSLAAVLGHLSAITVPTWFGYSDTSTAGMMAVMIGLICLAVVFVAPRHGLISRVLHRLSLGRRIAREDVLGLLYRYDELAGDQGRGMQRVEIRGALGSGRVSARIAVDQLHRRGQIDRTDGRYRLTDLGRRLARPLVRAHRLWEAYFHQQMNLPADHVHAPAEKLEHITDSAMRQRLAERVDQPQRDPQGKQIPGDDA
jgi:manganese/zinc/iron transport system permease protein